jgi:transcriptional regulator with GAF, ATPase, and Fis domain
MKRCFTELRDSKGRFELADKGTIFLDEIGDTLLIFV